MPSLSGAKDCSATIWAHCYQVATMSPGQTEEKTPTTSNVSCRRRATSVPSSRSRYGAPRLSVRKMHTGSASGNCATNTARCSSSMKSPSPSVGPANCFATNTAASRRTSSYSARDSGAGCSPWPRCSQGRNLTWQLHVRLAIIPTRKRPSAQRPRLPCWMWS